MMFAPLGLFAAIDCPCCRRDTSADAAADAQDTSIRACRHPRFFRHHVPSPTLEQLPEVPLNTSPAPDTVSSSPTRTNGNALNNQEVNVVPRKRAPAAPLVSKDLPHHLQKRVAHNKAPLDAAVVQPDLSVPLKLPFATRQLILQKLLDALLLHYAALPPAEQRAKAQAEARSLEADVARSALPTSYKNRAAQALLRIKKRAPFSADATPPDPSAITAGPPSTTSSIAQADASLTYEEWLPYLLTTAQLEKDDFPLDVVPFPKPLPVYLSEQVCDRCQRLYIVKPLADLQPSEHTACAHHIMGMMTVTNLGEKRRLFRCCGDLEPCTRSPHVYATTSFGGLLNQFEFCSTRSDETDGSITTSRRVLAMDCEMVHTTGGLEVGRISIVDAEENVVMDEYVLPDHPVVDYNERWSGLNAHVLAERAKEQRLMDLMPKLLALITTDTILVGHSLHGDLKCLRMIHGKVIDTSVLYPHERDPTRKRGLAMLAQSILHLTIQRGGGGGSSQADRHHDGQRAPVLGHDSIEDACTALKLAKHHILEQRRLAEKGCLLTREAYASTLQRPPKTK